MNKVIIHCLIGLFSINLIVAQTPCNNSFDCCIEKAKAFPIDTSKNKYTKALNELNAAEIYIIETRDADLNSLNDKKKKIVKELRDKIFEAIEKDRVSAIEESEKAKKATNNATAMFWATEAEKLTPSQRLSLLDKASKLAIDDNVIEFVKNQTKQIFNNSHKHQFLEIERINLKTYKYYKGSTDYQFFIIQNGSNDLELLEIKTKRLTCLNMVGVIKKVIFSPNNKYIFLDFKTHFKIWSIPENKVVFSFINNDIDKSTSLNSFFPYFSKDESFFRFRNKSEWQVFKLDDLNPQDLYLKSKAVSPSISPKSKWIIMSDYIKNQVQIYNTITNSTQIYQISENVKSGLGRLSIISNDDKYLLIGERFNFAIIFDLTLGKETLKIKNKNILIARFSMDNLKLIIKENDNMIRFWDLNTKNEIFLLPRQKFDWTNIANNTNWVLTKSYQSGCILKNIINQLEFDFLKNERFIETIFVTNDDKWLYTKDDNNNYKLWDIKRGILLKYFENPCKDFFINGDILYTISNDDLLKIWQIPNNEAEIFSFEGEDLADHTFSPNYNYVYISQPDDTYVLYHFDTKEKLEFRENLKVKTNNLKVKDFIFSPDEKYIITEHEDKYMVWELIKSVPNYKFKFKLDEENFDVPIFTSDSKWIIHKNVKYDLLKFGISEKIERKIHGDSDFEISDNGEWGLYNSNKTCRLVNLSTSETKEFDTNLSPQFSFDQKLIIYETSPKEYSFYDLSLKKDFKIKYKLINSDNIFKAIDNSLVQASKGVFYKFTLDKNQYVFKDSVAINDAGSLSISPNSSFAYYTNVNNPSLYYLNLVSFEKVNFSESNNLYYIFSEDDKFYAVQKQHKITIYETTTKEPITIIFTNKIADTIEFDDDINLYIGVGNTIIKHSIEKTGKFLYFGDGEPMDYENDEIIEWQRIFGEKYLKPLDDETKLKYNIK